MRAVSRLAALFALLPALLLGLCLVGCAALRADTQAEQLCASPRLILRYAENQPQDYPTTQAAFAFAELVKQRTGGQVEVRVYADGALGNELSVIDQMGYGGIDFARVSISQLAVYQPDLNVLQLPYLYEDADQMWRVLDGEIGDDFLNDLGTLNLQGLSWFDAGVRSFYTSTAVAGLDDLVGMNLRVQESDLMSQMILALGAVPVQLVYSQVYVALRKGDIDGAENNWPSYVAMGHYEVAPFVLVDEHTRVPEMQLASATAMNKLAELDETFPDIIRDCARESARTERELWVQTQNDALQQMNDEGCIITELSETERARFRAAVAPMYQNYAAQSDLIGRIKAA